MFTNLAFLGVGWVTSFWGEENIIGRWSKDLRQKTNDI